MYVCPWGLRSEAFAPSRPCCTCVLEGKVRPLAAGKHRRAGGSGVVCQDRIVRKLNHVPHGRRLSRQAELLSHIRLSSRPRPPMKPHRVRQICRSHNRFAPSIALWQHFIVPCHPHLLRQQRLSSTAAEATNPPHTGEAEIVPQPAVEQPGGEGAPQSTKKNKVKREKAGPWVRFRKVVDDKGEHKWPNVAVTGIRKNVEAKADRTRQSITDLLLHARMAFDEQDNYKGVVVNAMTSKYPTLEITLPWVVPLTEETQNDALGRLALEIEKFHEYAKPSRTEALARRHLIEQVRGHAREVLPDHVLEVFGSERTGIALATSDIDLRLKSRDVQTDTTPGVPPSLARRKELLDALYSLHRKKFQNSRAYILATLRHARYPLISMQDRVSGLDIQIVLSNDTSHSRDLMHRYMQEFPYLRSTYSVVRTIFESRGLADVFRGGFGSYSIFMMLVAALRHKPKGRKDAAGALLSFLDFWGHFDYTAHGVSIDPPEFFDKAANPVIPEKTKQQIREGSIKPLPPFMLSLRDPADETNDLGRKGVCINHVAVTLQNLYRKLRVDLRNNTRHSLILPLVGDVYSLNLNRRGIVERHGRSVLTNMQTSFAETAQKIREAESADA
ncbi:Nucleotidyltransferase [Massarina eburnea CBS 473.64]|uniref:polynucleotide adenylyltransferase n=1 Tax=Massarina eburnea CBS 473.64 TaxID=1395130 RepID=A0A6A6S1Z2_9PLEO|nr:Nucleotidyltransferase [Massarina eburnea CBS 473.64]